MNPLAPNTMTFMVWDELGLLDADIRVSFGCAIVEEPMYRLMRAVTAVYIRKTENPDESAGGIDGASVDSHLSG